MLPANSSSDLWLEKKIQERTIGGRLGGGGSFREGWFVWESRSYWTAEVQSTRAVTFGERENRTFRGEIGVCIGWACRRRPAKQGAEGGQKLGRLTGLTGGGDRSIGTLSLIHSPPMGNKTRSPIRGSWSQKKGQKTQHQQPTR